MENFAVKSKECLYKAKWTCLSLIHYFNQHKQLKTWEMVERTTRPKNGITDAVVIFALLTNSPKSAQVRAEDKVLLVKQFRPPAGKPCYELPAGLIDAGENSVQAAIRELREETGYHGKVAFNLFNGGEDSSEADGGGESLEPVVMCDPGLSSANMQIIPVLVDLTDPLNGSDKRKQDLQDEECIEVKEIPIGELLAFLRAESKIGNAIGGRLYSMALGLSLRSK